MKNVVNVNVKMNDYKCEKCNGTFKKCWSDLEAKKEFETAPWNISGDEIALICDNCFSEFKVWFDSLTDQDHKRIRN